MQTDGQVARSTIIFASITRVRASFPSFATNFFFPMVFIVGRIYCVLWWSANRRRERKEERKEERRKEKFEKRKKDERVSLA